MDGRDDYSPRRSVVDAPDDIMTANWQRTTISEELGALVSLVRIGRSYSSNEFARLWISAYYTAENDRRHSFVAAIMGSHKGGRIGVLPDIAPLKGDLFLLEGSE